MQHTVRATRCHHHPRTATTPLTYEDHQAGPLVGPLLVAGHLLVGEEVGVSGVGAFSRGALSVLTTQAETPPQTSCSEKEEEGTENTTKTNKQSRSRSDSHRL